ncbi:hypothetical protein T492DRAFT_1132222 [Pavlovales sp. CCMP2436]|nr:hypothetical protein T492DRAFT_1132222 [Pavlovales sp. CCMP2436]
MALRGCLALALLLGVGGLAPPRQNAPVRATALPRGAKRAAQPWIPLERAERLNAQLAGNAGETALLVDGNNVRGLTGFRWSSARLEALVRLWAGQRGLGGRVVIIWDHGGCSEAYAADGVGLCFAGPKQTADDVIASQVGVLVQAGVRRVWVATSDRELVERATAAGGTSIPGQTWKEAARAVMETGGLSSSSPKAPERKPTPKFKERTWHRVLLAERLRRLLAESASPPGLPDSATVATGLPDSTTAATGLGQGGAVPPPRQGWLGQYAQARAYVSDTRLDGEGRQALLRFAGKLASPGGSPTAAENPGVSPGSEESLTAEESPEKECADGGEEEGGQDGGEAPIAPSGSELHLPFRITRRQRRVLRSPRARHAGTRTQVAAGLFNRPDRDSAMLALDAWLSCN